MNYVYNINMLKILKERWYFVLISILTGIGAAIFGALALPFQRNGEQKFFVLSIVCYSILFLVTMFIVWLLFFKIKKADEYEPKIKSRFALFFYFSLILIISLFVTLFFVIVKAVNQNSIFLTQGILSFVLDFALLLFLLLPIELNINFIK